jgi:hypothetical protein
MFQPARRLALPIAVVAALAAGQAHTAMPIVQEVYNISPVACDGPALNGVRYAFTVAGTPSADCFAGTAAGPGVTVHISAPNIEGTASGVLHLTFDVPTTQFGFGVAQSTTLSPQQVIVHLNRPGVGLLREAISLSTTADPFFVGGRFDYRGPAVKTVTISFSNVGGRFAIDNTTYFRPPGQSK